MLSIILGIILIPSCFAANPKSRLPESIKPDVYVIDLNADPSKDTFDGKVNIVLNLESKVDSINLHMHPDYILNPVINLDGKPCNYTVENDTQIATITCTSEIRPGSFLNIEYTGKFANDMAGFYKSLYEEEDENKNVIQKSLLATQFEQMDARKAFPCFDEPSFKAKFNISITAPKAYNVVLSNTPLESSIEQKDSVVYNFDTTPVMSTYLVAFVIAQFKCSPNQNTPNYEYSVCYRPEAEVYSSTATTYGRQLIDLLSEFNGIEYQNLGINKSHQVGIPDFAAGAMENWGLITYREADLLDEAEQTTNIGKQKVVTVIAHELAHQWFGDYVTLGWWSDTWLNEGFATYFESFIPNQLPDKFELDKQFVVNVHQSVMLDDALSSSAPLSSKPEEVNTNGEATKKFGKITYNKGGSVIRMMSYILGQDKFKAGLQEYLKTFAYKNVYADDLLDVLNKHSSNRDVVFKDALEAWLKSPGFPLVTVSLKNKKLQFTQERFVSSSGEYEKTQWYIPITYTKKTNASFEIEEIKWMKPNAPTPLTIDFDSKDWVIVNLQESGFYRVNYDEKLWKRIETALKNKNFDNIHTLNRAQIVDDIYNLARIGKVSYSKAFTLSEYLENEQEYYPWKAALNGVSFVIDKISNEKIKQAFKNFYLKLMKGKITTKAENPKSHIEVLQNAQMLNAGCQLGDEDCIKYAKNQFAEFKKNNKLENTNYRSTIFCTALQNSNNIKEDWDALWNSYLNSKTSHEQSDILTALGCSKNEEVLKAYLLKTITNDSKIRKQDVTIVFRGVVTSQEGVNAALSFVDEKLNDIVSFYKGMGAVGDLISSLAKAITTEEHLKKFKAILEKSQDVEDVKVVTKEALEQANSNYDWSVKYAASLAEYFEQDDHDGGGSAMVSSNAAILLTAYALLKFYLF